MKLKCFLPSDLTNHQIFNVDQTGSIEQILPLDGPLFIITSIDDSTPVEVSSRHRYQRWGVQTKQECSVSWYEHVLNNMITFLFWRKSLSCALSLCSCMCTVHLCSFFTLHFLLRIPNCTMQRHLNGILLSPCTKVLTLYKQPYEVIFGTPYHFSHILEIYRCTYSYIQSNALIYSISFV